MLQIEQIGGLSRRFRSNKASADHVLRAGVEFCKLAVTGHPSSKYEHRRASDNRPWHGFRRLGKRVRNYSVCMRI